MTHPTVPLEVFRAWRGRRALLTGGAARAASATPAEHSILEVIARAGWMPATGSTAPYLSLRVRSDTCTRACVEQAVLQDRELVKVRGVRGESFLVPRDQAMIAVAVKGRRIDARIRQIAKVVPISRGEVETLAMAIAELLDDGPATEPDLEEGLPTGMLRNFGTEGRRAGVPGVLPVALEYLEEEGRVLHLDEGDRLDSEKRRYWLTEKALPEVASPAPEQLEVLPQALALYLGSFGPARLEDFVWWAGTTLNRTRSAAEALDVSPATVEVEGLEGELAILPEDLESLLAFTVPDLPDVALIPNRDCFYAGRKVLTREFLDFDAPERVLARFRGKAVAARVLPTVIVNGRVVGIWEWQPTERQIVWAPFPAADEHPELSSAVTEAVGREADWLAERIRDDLDGEIVLDPAERGTHWAYEVEEIRTFW